MSLDQLHGDNILSVTPSQLAKLAHNEQHYKILFKARRRVQVKLNVQKLRLRRQKERLLNEKEMLNIEITFLKKQLGVH